MSETLTREQIEELLKYYQAGVADYETLLKGTDDVIERWAEVEIEKAKQHVALCNMALSWIEVQPRPLSEIDASDVAIVRHKNGFGYFVSKYPSGKWLHHTFGEAWPETTLAVPLSSLPEPK